MAGVEDLYQSLLGRQADAEGLQFWNNALASGVSYERITQDFLNSAEYQSRQAAPSTVVNGIDLSKYTWDQLAGEVHNDKLTRSQGDGGDMYGGYGYSSILGADVQGYVDTNYDRYVREHGYVRPDDFGVDANKFENLSNLNFKAKDGPEGYMTSLYRNADGSIGIGHYKEEDNFLMDMVMFVAAAYTMYTGVNALGGALSGAAPATGGATSGASVGGTSASGVSELATTVAPTTETGFQVTQLTAPWEPVATNTLGSGTYGIEAVDGLVKLGTTTSEGFSLGGLTLTESGELITAGSSFSASQGAATLPWVNPAPTTITDIVINSSGSVTNMLNGTGPWDQYAEVHTTGMPTTPSTPSTSTPAETPATPPPAEPSLLDKVPDVVKDIATGVIGGAIVDAITPKPSTPGGGGTGTATGGAPIINIPKPDPTASALQPASNQRAGVKFGRTKSKRQLKGKFSGTGISLK